MKATSEWSQDAVLFVNQALSLNHSSFHRSSTKVVLVQHVYRLHVLRVGSLLIGSLALGVCLMHNGPASQLEEFVL